VGGKPLLNICSGYLPAGKGRSAIPSLRFGAASIPQPFIGISFLIFYYAIDYVLHNVQPRWGCVL
jgi:hypothetical protein